MSRLDNLRVVSRPALMAVFVLVAGLALLACQAAPATQVAVAPTTPAPTSTVEQPPSATPTPPATATSAPTLTSTAVPLADTSTPAIGSTPTSTPIPVSPSPTLPARPAIVSEFYIEGLPAAARQPSAMGRLGDRLYVVSRTDNCVAIIENQRMTTCIPVGDDPGALAVNQALDEVFVASEAEQAVYVIRGLGVAEVWPVRATPVGLSSSVGSLYVAFDAGEGIDVLDTKMGSLQRSFPAPVYYGPVSMAIDEGNRRLYFSGYRNASILDLDVGEWETLADINNYLILAVDSARGRWYTNDYDSENSAQWLIAMDMQTGQEIGRCPLGGDPRQALVDPATGMVYVANSWSNTVSVIEPDDLSVVATILVGQYPTSLALSEEGDRLYVTNSESHSVAVIDLAEYTLDAAIPLAIIPSDLEFDSVRGYLYVALPAANAVYVVQDGSLQQVVRVGIEPLDIDVDLASGALYVANYVSGDVSMVTPGSWQVETMALADAPTSVTVDSVQRRLYAGNEVLAAGDLGRLGEITLQGMTVDSRVMPVESAVDTVSNRLFAVAFNAVPGSGGAYVMYALDTETGEQLSAPAGGAGVTAMTLNREERRLYWAAGRFGTYMLYVNDLDTLESLAQYPLGPIPVDLAYIPTSHHLYVLRGSLYTDDPGQWGIQILDSRSLGEVAYWPLGSSPILAASDPLSGRVFASVGYTGRMLTIQDVPLPAPPAPTPTLTPSPWPTWTPAPTVQPAAQPAPTPCGDWLNAFGPFWSTDVQMALGCPVAMERQLNVAEQPFERGRMFWRSDEEVIYVLLSDGAYVERGDAWVGPAEYACVANAPSGLLQPKRGFGLVWCSAGGLRDDVGWALEEEKLYADIIQEFEYGMMILAGDGAAYMLLSDASWRVIEMNSQ